MKDPAFAILRRFLLWTLLCSISAAPSFFWAHKEFNWTAVFCGIGLFILFYTAITSTDFVLQFKEKPFVRRTLYIGYGTRLVVSILLPFGLTLDLFPGMLSVEIGKSLFGSKYSFTATLVITIIQGTLLNIILGVYMLVVYILQRAFMKPQVREGYCRQCGYDLRASPLRCPECGEPNPEPKSTDANTGVPSSLCL